MSEVKRALVAMSGGVDSSLAAALLQAQGFQVIGITIRLWNCQDPSQNQSCCGFQAEQDARAVCQKLGLRHYVVDGTEQFSAEVLRPAWEEYKAGRTPNPCVQCNEKVKFRLLLEYARQVGATKIATGHYCVVQELATGEHALLRGQDPLKDQTYFLFALDPEVLPFLVFPLGGMNKREVRQQATALQLPTASRRESQDACVAGTEHFGEWLRLRFGGPAMAGDFVDEQGRVLGHHQGIHQYTVGQRRGLGVAHAQRLYVKAISSQTGRIVLTADKSRILQNELEASHVNWLGDPESLLSSGPLWLQTRYRQRPLPVAVELLGKDRMRCVGLQGPFEVTPGQAAVVYSGERLLGGGWIDG